MEILRQHQGQLTPSSCRVGGGLIARSPPMKYLRPEIKVMASSRATPTPQTALQKGRRVTLSQVGQFADGVAVAQIGTPSISARNTWMR